MTNAELQKARAARREIRARQQRLINRLWATRTARRGAQLWRWLGARWEPIIALCALTVAVISAVVSIRGVALAHAGIEVAVAAQRVQSIEMTMAMTPMAIPKFDEQREAIVIENIGIGLANVYQIDFMIAGRLWTIDQSTPLPSQPARMDAIYDSLLQHFDVPTALLGYDQGRTDEMSRFPLLRPDETALLLGYSQSDLSLAARDKIEQFWDELSVRICYTDYIGNQSGFGLYGNMVPDAPCGSPPKLVTLN